MAEYSMPTDESLVRVAEAIEAGNGLLQRVIGGYIMFCSAKPDESSITTKPCLVIVTTTGEMYLVADDLQAAAKQDPWPDEEEDEAKAAPSWDEDDGPATDTVDGPEARASDVADGSQTTDDSPSAETAEAAEQSETGTVESSDSTNDIQK